MPIDTPAWARDAVFYQIFPDRFAASDRVPKPGPMEPWDAPPTVHGYKGGDLLGIAEHLDELADLGITALYLTPVFASASNHRYHTDDYYSVDPLLGGNEALRELLDQAHARDMRVVLDGVFNHCGRGFWRFHHVAEAGAASPYPALVPPRRGAPRGRPAAGASTRATSRRPRSGALSRRGHGCRRGVPARAGIRGLVGPAGAAQAATSTTPRPGPTCWMSPSTGCGSASMAGGWMSRRRSPATSGQEFRERCRAVRPGRLPGGRDLAAQAGVAHRAALRCAHELPAGRGDPGLRGGPTPGPARGRAQHDEYRRYVVPRDAASFAAELERLQRLYDPDVTAVMLNLLGSHDAPRLAPCAAATSRPSASRRCSR